MTAAATITDISTAGKKAKTDNISASLVLPEDLHQKLMLDVLLSKRELGPMVEDWIDQNVSLQDVTVGLASIMTTTTTREKLEPGVVMKTVSVPISKKHYGLIKMESLRQNTSIRALLKTWVQENVGEWNVQPVTPEAWQNRKAA